MGLMRHLLLVLGALLVLGPCRGAAQLFACTQKLTDAYACQNEGGCYTDTLFRSFCICSRGFGGPDCSVSVVSSCQNGVVVDTPTTCAPGAPGCNNFTTTTPCKSCPGNGAAGYCANGGKCVAVIGCDCTGTGFDPGSTTATCRKPSQSSLIPAPPSPSASPGTVNVPSKPSRLSHPSNPPLIFSSNY